MSKRSTKRGHTLDGDRLHVKAVLPPALQSLLQPTLQRRPCCLLCGGPHQAVGVFVPTYPERWGFPAGFRAGCTYGVCQRCLARPDTQDRVEAALWDDRQKQRQAPWN